MYLYNLVTIIHVNAAWGGLGEGSRNGITVPQIKGLTTILFSVIILIQ